MRKAFFCGRCAQWHAVEHDLITGGAQQKSRISALIQCRAQFLPRSFKLRHRAHVAKFVQPGKLQQNVQAVDK
ncbi:MAG: hypothetical protein ACLPSO_00025 [Terracidiphilus sp.]